MTQRDKYTPRGYQTLITQHIVNTKRCQIWAGMGMGKTVSTLTALEDLHLCGEDDPVLVLAPLRVAQSTWPDEVSKWEHLKHVTIIPVVGTEAERRAALRYKARIYTTNYENIPWLVEYFGERWPFGTVVSDESTRLKSLRISFRTSTTGKEYLAGQGGKRAKELGRVAHTKIKRFIGLTGTPAPNGLQDVWGPTWFCDRGVRLGRTYEAFKTRWFRPSRDGYGLVPLDHAQNEIQEKLKDICLTVDPKDWFDLKEPIVSNVYIDLNPRARNLYDEMEENLFVELDGHDVEAFNAATKTQKLLQISSGAMYVDPEADSDGHPRAKEWKVVHDAKLKALEDIVEEAAGMPVLVAYHFKSDLARILKAFPAARELDKNPQTIKDWNEGKIPILLAHPASAGHGLSLQHGGNIIVFFSHDWNLENRLQITERIGPVRQLQSGYDRPVFIYNIVARRTADEMVLERVATKKDVQQILLDAMKRRK